MLVTTPDVHQDDLAVVQSPILTSTKWKKPAPLPKGECRPLKTRHKRLAAFIASKSKPEDLDDNEQVSDASRSIFCANWAFDFLRRLLLDCYQSFWQSVASPICPLALRLVFSREQELRALVPPPSEKLKLAYGTVALSPAEPTTAAPALDVPELSIYLPKKRVKHKQPSIADAVYAIKRVLVTLERTPEHVSVEKDKHLNKGLDVPLQNLLEYLALVDLACLKDKGWSRAHQD